MLLTNSVEDGCPPIRGGCLRLYFIAMILIGGNQSSEEFGNLPEVPQLVNDKVKT